MPWSTGGRCHGHLCQVNDTPLPGQQIASFAGSSRNGGETNHKTTTPSKKLPGASTVRLSVIFPWYFFFILSPYHSLPFLGDDNAQPVEGQALVRPQLRAAQLSFSRLQKGARNHQWGRKGLLRGIRGWTEEILCLFSEINFHMAHVDSKAHNSLFLEQNVWQYRSRQIGALFILDLCKLFVLTAVSEILLLWLCKQISN